MINKIKYHLLPARLKTRWNFNEYLYYRMQEKSKSEIENFITEEELEYIEKYLNKDSHRNIFNSKQLFYARFKELMGRTLIVLAETPESTFMDFLEAKNKLILKPDNLYAGLGIYIVTYEKGNIVSIPSGMPDYNELQRKNYIAEEFVTQHTAYENIYGGCLNTIRVTTFLNDCSVPYILFAANQFGSRGSIVDNNDETSIWSIINTDTGIIEYTDIDSSTSLFNDKHPDSHADIMGFKNPYFDKIKELSLKAALKVPECRLIGWDIAVTNREEVIIIEGNVTPELDLYRRLTGKDLCMLYHILFKLGLR